MNVQLVDMPNEEGVMRAQRAVLEMREAIDRVTGIAFEMNMKADPSITSPAQAEAVIAAPIRLICERCGKKLSRKRARQIDGKVLCSPCVFAPPARAV